MRAWATEDMSSVVFTVVGATGDGVETEGAWGTILTGGGGVVTVGAITVSGATVGAGGVITGGGITSGVSVGRGGRAV